MFLNVLGLVSIDTLGFYNNKHYVGGGGLATAWASALWGIDSYLYSIDSNTICQRIIDENSKYNRNFAHLPINTSIDTVKFIIEKDELSDGYNYRIIGYKNYDKRIIRFLSLDNSEKYIKLSVSNYELLNSAKRCFSINPQGDFDLMKFCNIVNKTRFIFLNINELLHSSKMNLLEVLKYIENNKHSFVITLGKDGSICYYHDNDEWWFFPSINSDKYMSSLGCGDAFAGGFLSAFIKGLPIKLCLARGTISAYCALYSPNNIINNWISKKSLAELNRMRYPDFCFSNASDLYSFILKKSNRLDLPISLDNIIGNWEYGDIE